MSRTARFDVVVGVNGTGSSLHAVKWAAMEVASRQGTLRLVYAWSPESYAPLQPVSAQTEELTADATAEAMRVLEIATIVATTMSPGLDVQTELVVGSPSLVLSAASQAADLLVLGDRGPGVCTGMIVGSVATTLVDLTACPVLIVRGRVDKSGPVVVGVDGSASDTPLLAAAFASADRAKTWVLAVQTWRHDASRVLDESLADFALAYPDVRVERHVDTGSPAAALVLASAGARLVIVGSHGAGAALSDLLSAACTGDPHHTHSPVEVVRSPRAA